MLKKGLLLVMALFMASMTIAQDVLTPELLWDLGRVNGGIVSPDGTSMIYGVVHYDLEKNSGKNELFIKDTKTGKDTKINLAGSPNSMTWTPDGQRIAFLMGGQLHEIKPDGSGLKQISDVKGGISTFNYAPTGDKVAYSTAVKLKKTTADLYPQYDKANAVVIDDLMYRHWDHWSDADFNHVFVADLKDDKLTNAKDIMGNEPFDCPTEPFGGSEDYTFSPDGSKVVYVTKKKEGKDYAVSTNTDLYVYELATGATSNFTEGMMGYDTHPTFSNDGQKLAWFSMARDGYESDKNDIIVYDFKSKTKTNITKDWDETVSTFIWGEKDRNIYFVAGHQATIQLWDYKLAKNVADSDVKNIRMITEGVHDYRSVAQLNSKTLIGSRMSMSEAPELFTVDIKNGTEKPLTDVNKDIFDNLKMGKVEKRMVATTDGKEELVWVVYPPNFDPNKKYPALLYCQGGPQSAVSQFFSFRWNFQLMAAQGYIVVAPNRRGLPSFGTKWNEDISKDWGGQPMKDYLSAIDAVAAEPYVDNDRLGCVGASYGGYSVYMLAGIHEGRFSAFISHCGLFDMKSWYGTTEELFFANWDLGGAYWEKNPPKAYTEFNPSNYVQNWDTPMMVIHGGHDFRVPEGQGMQAFQAAKLKGIPARFLYFPEEGHWVLNPQNGMIWHTEYFKWLDQWLKK
ncbi:S9 family peptidase [Persicobacter psychrovividus]|uniref:Peptidase S9 n=1 Tax=Persicobacter psychrovividus TaxID=387638 RepID=A0ABM7VE42_9BACT|nr:peptidase S9 [Persicobacter psychrovividus]